jgi:hypothetical protein
MNLFELKRLIREEVVKATQGGQFGSYLFGRSRDLPNKKKPEINTKEEEQLRIDLCYQYLGDQERLTKWVPIIDKLEKEGKYTDILSVPAKYKYAYRIMSNLSLSEITKILGYEPTKYVAGQIYEETKGLFEPFPGRIHHSWTVRSDAFKDILDDWGKFLSRSKLHTFVVIFRAPISENRFLLNPDNTEFLSKSYAYQDEVISVGEVACDHVWYIPMSNKKGTVRGLEKKIVNYVPDYERSRR